MSPGSTAWVGGGVMARRQGAIVAIAAAIFFFSSRRRHTRCYRDWSSDVCSSDLAAALRQSWDAEAALRRIKQAPRERAQVIRLAARGGAETPPVPRRVFAAAFAIAATLAILVGGLAVWQAGLFSRGEKEPQTEVATRRGQRVTVRFPDGTAVLLGPVSTLRYAG